MIQHEALPLDPDHEEVFEVPDGLQIGVSAFIKIYQKNEYVGEASALDKIPNKAHSWALTKVMLFTNMYFDTCVTVKTLLLTAKKLCYVNNEGWVITAFNDIPLQEIEYVGYLLKIAGAYEFATNTVRMYEHMAFQAEGKGKSL